MTNDLALRISNAETLDVRSFRVDERIGSPFLVDLVVRSSNSDLDFETLIGESARFDLGKRRAWAGVVRAVHLSRAEPNGLSTYRVEIVPKLWLLTQRRNHRIYQRMTEPDMAMELLSEWNIPFQSRLDRAAYKKRDYRVQYAESDFAFLSRMLEDAGITYWFHTPGTDDAAQARVILCDATHATTPRRPIAHVDDASAVPPGDFATRLSVTRELLPTTYTISDVDYRLSPEHRLQASSSCDAKPVESALESFHYVPGAFLFEGQSGDTPSADDKLAVRTSPREAELLARRRLEAKRGDALTFCFSTNALELAPGDRVAITDHPRGDLGPSHPLLITAIEAEGDATGVWTYECRGRRGTIPFRPPLTTPKPRTAGIETAIVVGPAGEEIHTDEHGRVRVHFHWDRRSRMNDDSSCWLPVSQSWAGAGFGGINLPRVGQEVIVDFLNGDPDRPMVIGRVFTTPRPVP